MLDNLGTLSVPSTVHGWVASFLSNRSHTTIFDGQTSSPKCINSGVVQGSALGPAAFAIVSSDLRANHNPNALDKFADDSYLIVPASNLHTTEDELLNIENWATENNLQLNRTKSKEIIFQSPNSKRQTLDIPLLEGIERVSDLKCLGVTLSGNFSFSAHITSLMSSCSSNIFALYSLRTKGLSNELLQIVFKASTLSKLLYASQFWWGFAKAEDRNRLEAFLRRAKRAGFYCNESTFEDLCASADSKLFKSICANPNHLLGPLLPPLNSHIYSTRRNTAKRCYTLPTKRSSLSDRNFIARMILNDASKI